jgi:hypothetical protein
MLYTSGFNNKDEHIKLGIIKINNVNKITNPYNIKLTKNTNVNTYENIKLLNNNIFYDAINLITLSHNDIKDLKSRKIIICLDDILE